MPYEINRAPQNNLDTVRIINEKLNAHTAEYADAQEIAKVAAAFCPVDTGALMHSIRAWQNDNFSTVTAGNQDVGYAVYVEFGTFKMRAQPYLRPAVDLVRHTKIMREHLAAEIMGRNAWELPGVIPE